MNVGPAPQITPSVDARTAAAIVAAVEANQPRPVSAEEPDTDRSRNWRFSGRWWRRDRFADATRPWS